MKKYLIAGLIIAGLLWGWSIWGASKRVLSWSYDDTAGLLTPVGPNISGKAILAGDSTGQAPGVVPLGGMVAIAKSDTGAWQPAASGVIKDGFQLADGAAYHGDCSLSGDTPPMNNAYIKGNTSSSGDTGGANSQTLVETNLPSHTHSINHNHPSAADAALNAGGHFHYSVNRFTDSTSIAAGQYMSHRLASGDDYAYQIAGRDSATPDAGKSTTGGAHTHTVDIPAFTGTSGSTGSGTSFVNEPSYVTMVWVVRCK